MRLCERLWDLWGEPQNYYPENECLLLALHNNQNVNKNLENRLQIEKWYKVVSATVV